MNKTSSDGDSPVKEIRWNKNKNTSFNEGETEAGAITISTTDRGETATEPTGVLSPVRQMRERYHRSADKKLFQEEIDATPFKFKVNENKGRN